MACRQKVLAILAGLGLLWCNQAFAAKGVTKPPATKTEVKYGPHASNVFDFWKASSAQPTPLMVYIHGGGFHTGTKGQIPPDIVVECLKLGISVASVNYRLSQQAPYPAQFLDSARALQFLRANAKDYNIDPTRVALSGSSAGGVISLWIGFHDDLADPKAADPVLRQSTRVLCIYTINAPCSCDPVFIKATVGDRPATYFAGHQMFAGKGKNVFAEASPITYATPDDPPIFATYNKGAGSDVHSSKFGDALKKKLDELKVPCTLVKGAVPDKALADFLGKYLKSGKK